MCSTVQNVCRVSFTHLRNWQVTFHVQRSSSQVYAHFSLGRVPDDNTTLTQGTHSRCRQGMKFHCFCITPDASFSKSNPTTSVVRPVQMCKNTARGKHSGFHCAPTLRRLHCILTLLCAFFAQFACSRDIMGTCPTTLQPLFVS